MLRFGRFQLFVLLASLFITLHLAAQTELGAVRGQIGDQRGGAIANATVGLHNPVTSWERTTQTDAAGNYSFSGVPLTGQYVVSVSAPQFKAARKRSYPAARGDNSDA